MTAGPPTDAEVLLDTLLDKAAELLTLVETADLVAADACERVAAGSAAVLVEDRGNWAVAGGHDLRSLERRYAVAQDHWLVTEIVATQRAAIVEDTDVVRRELRGLPLADRRHLLVVPVGSGLAVIMVGRQEDRPFTEPDLLTLADLAGEAERPLRTALTVRRLARALEGHL